MHASRAVAYQPLTTARRCTAARVQQQRNAFGTLLPQPGCQSTSPPARTRPTAQQSMRPQAPHVGSNLPSDLQNDSLPGHLSLLAFAANALLSRRSVPGLPLTPNLIYAALAWTTLAHAALSVVQGKAELDPVGTTAGPLWLASQALGGIPGLHLSPWQAATAAFGTLLIKRLPTFPYSNLVWLGSLAGAVWKGWGAEWTVAAFGLAAAWRVIRGFQNKAVPYHEVAFAAFAAAAYDAYMPAALAIYAGHIAASVLS